VGAAVVNDRWPTLLRLVTLLAGLASLLVLARTANLAQLLRTGRPAAVSLP
jgi:hypothetical protein